MTTRRRLALVIPESGPRRQWGALLDESVRDIPDLDVFDDHADPSRSIMLAEHLADDAGIYAVVGHFSSSAARLALPLYAAAGIHAVYPMSSADNVVTEHLSSTLGVVAPMPPDSYQARAVAAHCVGRRATAITLTPGGDAAGTWTELGLTLASDPSDVTDAEVIFVIGQLDGVVDAWHHIESKMKSGIEVVLSDDSWAGALELARRASDNARLSFVRSQPEPRKLLDLAVSHSVAMRDLNSSTEDFVARWEHGPAYWTVTPWK